MDDATRGLDQTRNNALLNDRLKKVEGTYRAGGKGAVADSGKVPGGGGYGSPDFGLPAGRASRWRAGGFEDFNGDGVASAARVGLMGVDVPLPTDGTLYWFVGARAGAAVSFDSSPEGMSPWLRALLALGLFGALGFVLARVARRGR